MHACMDHAVSALDGIKKRQGSSLNVIAGSCTHAWIMRTADPMGCGRADQALVQVVHGMVWLASGLRAGSAQLDCRNELAVWLRLGWFGQRAEPS